MCFDDGCLIAPFFWQNKQKGNKYDYFIWKNISTDEKTRNGFSTQLQRACKNARIWTTAEDRKEDLKEQTTEQHDHLTEHHRSCKERINHGDSNGIEITRTKPPTPPTIKPNDPILIATGNSKWTSALICYTRDKKKDVVKYGNLVTEEVEVDQIKPAYDKNKRGLLIPGQNPGGSSKRFKQPQEDDWFTGVDTEKSFIIAVEEIMFGIMVSWVWSPLRLLHKQKSKNQH
jgi:hypothetical protein